MKKIWLLLLIALLAIIYFFYTAPKLNKNKAGYDKGANLKNTEGLKIIDEGECILCLPSDLDSNKKYPLVVLLSPSAYAKGEIYAWLDLSKKYKLILCASKEYRNGGNMQVMIRNVAAAVKKLLRKYPIDGSKIISAGFSGGGMGSHFFCYSYPELISAVIINTGKMHNYQIMNKGRCPRGKRAVFLASPTDKRYIEMKRDKKFCELLGWKTKWIEFQGGHRRAPEDKYDEAIGWLLLNM